MKTPWAAGGTPEPLQLLQYSRIPSWKMTQCSLRSMKVAREAETAERRKDGGSALWEGPPCPGGEDAAARPSPSQCRGGHLPSWPPGRGGNSGLGPCGCARCPPPGSMGSVD